MELKRILAKDLRRATEKAVKLYGEDVLVISSARRFAFSHGLSSSRSTWVPSPRTMTARG